MDRVSDVVRPPQPEGRWMPLLAAVCALFLVMVSVAHGLVRTSAGPESDAGWSMIRAESRALDALTASGDPFPADQRALERTVDGGLHRPDLVRDVRFTGTAAEYRIQVRLVDGTVFALSVGKAGRQRSCVPPAGSKAIVCNDLNRSL